MRETWRWLAVWVAVSGSNAACATPQNSSSQHVRDRRTSTTDASSPIRFPQEAAGPARTIISAEARVEGTAPGDLVVVASAANPGADTVSLTFGSCALRVALRGSSATSGSTGWDLAHRRILFNGSLSRVRRSGSASSFRLAKQGAMTDGKRGFPYQRYWATRWRKAATR